MIRKVDRKIRLGLLITILPLFAPLPSFAMEDNESIPKVVSRKARLAQANYEFTYGTRLPVSTFEFEYDQGELYEVQSLWRLMQILKAVPDIFKQTRNPDEWDLESLSDADLNTVANLSSEYIEYMNSDKWGTELFHQVENNLSNTLKKLTKAKGLGSNAMKCFDIDYFNFDVSVVNRFKREFLRICDEHKDSLLALYDLACQVIKDPRADLDKGNIKKIAPFRDLYGHVYDEIVFQKFKKGIAELKNPYPWIGSKNIPDDLSPLSPLQRLEMLSYICEWGEAIKGLSPHLLKNLFGDVPWAPHRLRDKLAHFVTLLKLVTEDDPPKDVIYRKAIKNLYDLSDINLSTLIIPSWDGFEGLWSVTPGNAPAVIPQQDPGLEFQVLQVSANDIEACLKNAFFYNASLPKAKPCYQIIADWENHIGQLNDFFIGKGLKDPLALHKQILEPFLQGYSKSIPGSEYDPKFKHFFAHNFDSFLNQLNASWDEPGAKSRRKDNWSKIAKDLSNLSISDTYIKFRQNLIDCNILFNPDLLPPTYDWNFSEAHSPYMSVFHKMLGIAEDLQERKNKRLNDIKNIINEIEELQKITCLISENSSPLRLEDINNLGASQDFLVSSCWKLIQVRSIKGNWRNNMRLGGIKSTIEDFITKNEGASKGLFLFIGSIYESLIRILDYPELSSIMNKGQLKEVRNHFFHRSIFDDDYLQFNFETVSTPKSFSKEFNSIVADEAAILLINVHFLLQDAYDNFFKL